MSSLNYSDTKNAFSPIIPDIIPLTIALSGFTTRQGGVSKPPFYSLNFGLSSSDNPADVKENYSRLCSQLSVDAENTALMRQIHEAAVIRVSKGGIYDSIDGMVTDASGLLLGVRVADCAPALLLDPSSKAVGVVHCGWRSLVSGILENTLSLMKREWNTKPEEVIWALGPSAGPCCYKVGEEVASRMAPSSILSRKEGLYADLHAEITHRLLKAGTSITNIQSMRHCTICNKSLYYSHRRDGVLSGRMMGYIMLKKC
jgi:polyphenol oxidase